MSDPRVVGPRNPALWRALEIRASLPTPENEAAVRQVLGAARLVLGVKEVPPAFAGRLVRVSDDVKVPVLGVKTGMGGRALAAFTDVDSLHARSRGCLFIAAEAAAVFRMTIEGRYEALVLNPAGRGLEIPVDEIAVLARRIDPRAAAGAEATVDVQREVSNPELVAVLKRYGAAPSPGAFQDAVEALQSKFLLLGMMAAEPGRPPRVFDYRNRSGEPALAVFTDWDSLRSTGTVFDGSSMGTADLVSMAVKRRQGVTVNPAGPSLEITAKQLELLRSRGIL